MLDQLLDCVKLGAGGDVVAPVVQFPNLIVLDVVSLGLVPIPDGEGVGTYMGGQGSGWVREGCSPWCPRPCPHTFRCLTLPDEEGAPAVAVAQELPLRVLAPDLPKVPPAWGQAQSQVGTTRCETELAG